MMSGNIVLSNLRLVTMAGARNAVEPIEDAVVEVRDGAVRFAGPRSAFEGALGDARDMQGALGLPGFVACSNPSLWIGTGDPRAGTDGQAYRQLVREIAATTTAAAEPALLEVLRDRTEALARTGVTACELKSGFGTSASEELRLAAILRAFAGQTRSATTVTLFVGHQFPEDSDADEILAEIETEIVPRTYETGCADAVEVFCDDDGALDLDPCSTILELYYRKKFPSRVACDRFSDSAGATLPASFYSRAAIFLNHADETGLATIASIGCTAVFIPELLDGGTALPDVAAIREAGGRIAVSTHSGPDGPAAPDMLNTLRLAMTQLGLTEGEAIAAATVNAAHVLGLDRSIGSLAPGMRGDLALFDAPNPAALLRDDRFRCLGTVRAGHLDSWT